MPVKYLDKGVYLFKFLSNFIEINYHTLNFLSKFNLPIHYICKENCHICRINSLIEQKLELIQEKFEQVYGKKLYPKKKTEFAILVSDITSKDGKLRYDNITWLLLKPWQCLPIIDRVIQDQYPSFNDPYDSYMLKIVYDDRLYVSEVYQNWVLIDPNLITMISEELSNIHNIYQRLNIQTETDTATYLYVNLVKRFLTEL